MEIWKFLLLNNQSIQLFKCNWKFLFFKYSIFLYLVPNIFICLQFSISIREILNEIKYYFFLSESNLILNCKAKE